MAIHALSPKAVCFYLQALTAWLPCQCHIQSLDEGEDGDEELTDEERCQFEALEQQEQVFHRWLWNHGDQKNHGSLHLRWGEDGELDIDLDRRAVMRLLHFLCDEQARRQRDIEYDV